MDDLELIQVNTGKSVTEVEDVLAADLGGQWTTSGMRGRVLAAAAGRVSVVSDPDGIVVFPRATEASSERAFAERVFEVLAKRLPCRLELLDGRDETIRVRPAQPVPPEYRWPDSIRAQSPGAPVVRMTPTQ